MASHPLLLPEILGFVPQLLLDDIINIANNAVQDGVNGMEEFLEKWVDARAAREGGDWDGTQEVEQGLVAFQTLLEYHTDIAFDFFEAWSLRNIFAIPPDLPIVMPHQQNLDLTMTPEKGKEVTDELEDLRAKLNNVRLFVSLPISFPFIKAFTSNVAFSGCTSAPSKLQPGSREAQNDVSIVSLSLLLHLSASSTPSQRKPIQCSNPSLLFHPSILWPSTKLR